MPPRCKYLSKRRRTLPCLGTSHRATARIPAAHALQAVNFYQRRRRAYNATGADAVGGNLRRGEHHAIGERAGQNVYALALA